MTRAALRSGLALAFLAAASGASLRAQEPWSTGFRLVAGSFSGATDAGLGQDKNYGLAMWGAYPVSRSGSLEFEGGYRYFPGATYGAKNLSIRNKSDGYYGGAFYRHKLWFEGFYLQAGLRVWAMKATQTSTVDNGDGTSTRVEVKGPGGTATKPVFGAGLRLNSHYSISLNAAQAEFKNAAGAAKSGTLLEAALTIHF
ncbi:MAG: hypothetical protein U0P81_10270 [Holophagaceae bacterium]